MGSLFRRGDGRISFEEFSAAVTRNGYADPAEATYWSFLKEARNVKIFDKQELSMVLAHFIYESDGFVERRENVDVENYPEEYKDEACDVPGQFYYGRGFLKISKCKNYREISNNLFGDDRLVENPDLVATDEETAMKVGFSLWKRKVSGQPGVSEGHFGVTTNAIAGKAECSDGDPIHIPARKRYEIYKTVRTALKLENGVNSDAEKGCYPLDEFMKASVP